MLSENRVGNGITNLIRNLIHESVSSDGEQAGFEFFFDVSDNFLPRVVALLDNCFIILLEGFEAVGLFFIFSLSHL